MENLGLNETTQANPNFSRKLVSAALVVGMTLSVVGLLFQHGDQIAQISSFSDSISANGNLFSEPVRGISFLEKLENEGKTQLLSHLKEDDVKLLFEGYTLRFQKTYDDVAERERRYQIFKANLHSIDNFNDKERLTGGSAIHWITKFADVDPSEFFSSRSNMKKPSSMLDSILEIPNGEDLREHSKATSKDWSGHLTTDVDDQGTCGGCWAFSTVYQMESDAIRAGLWSKHERLSVQQLLACDKESLGCRGGWTEAGFMYIAKNGIVSADDYQYKEYHNMEVSEKCRTMDEDKKVLTISKAYLLKEESKMINHVLTTGPLSVCVDGRNWLSYHGGIMTSCGKEANHCVQIVGVDTNEKYWKVRNTWGSNWGEDGYIRLQLGVHACDITDDPLYVDVVKYGTDTYYNS